jgi:hypothetical protein
MSKEFDIRVIPNIQGPWNKFYGETVIKASPGWITASGQSIENGKFLGAKFLIFENFAVAQSVSEWLERVKVEPIIYTVS